jgi:sugar lactone lactonase YvrE
MLALAVLACQDPPVHRPPDQPDPCEVDPVGKICTIAGDGNPGVNGDDLPATDTWLFLPSFFARDPQGRLVVVDYNNYRIRRLDEDGVLRTVAGNGAHGYAIQGANALETPLENPVSAVYAPDGTMFVYEQHGARILKVDPAGTVTVYAGSVDFPGYDDYSGDGGPALDAGMSEGNDLALDEDGTLYFADTLNNCVRYVTPDGTMQTLAGDGEPSMQDGVGEDARFNWPWALELAGDTLYVTDVGNNAVRAIDLRTREVTTLAGGFPNPEPGDDLGDGGPAIDARLFGPQGVSLGPDGGLYVADSYDDAVRRIDLVDGTIATVVGQLGVEGFSGDGGPPEDAELKIPWDVLVTASGDLYVMDTWNARVRMVRGFLGAE